MHGGLGLALWRGEDLLDSTSIQMRAVKNWVQRETAMVDAAVAWVDGRLNGFYYELPYTTNNAASAKQDIVKLTTISGMLAHALCSPNKIFAQPIPVIEWKGQLTDDMVQERVSRILARRYPDYTLSTETSHEYDAVGIGLHAIGEAI